jgi:hypothetical protein
MRQIKIGNVVIPQPNVNIKYSRKDIAGPDDGRALSSLMWKNIIGTKFTLNLEWSYLPDDMAALLLDTIKGNTLQDAQGKTYIQVEFPSPYTGQQEVREFYTGDPDIELLLVDVNDVCYWHISMNIIER